MRLLLPLLLSLAALAGCGPSGKVGPTAGTTPPTLQLAPEDLLTLRLATLAGGPVVSGSLQPERRADLRAEVAAVVLQVLKDNGEAVRAGELLVRLDDTAIRESLASAEEAVRAAGQTFDQSERQVQRLKTLQAQGMTSTQALEDAELRRNNAQSDLVAARARVVAARQQLQRTLVRAPFDGVLSERKTSVGDTAQIGKELVKVIDPRSMRFEGLVTADRAQELKVGQPVSFRVNGRGNTDFAGRLRRIDAAANATTRQVAVIVDFAQPSQAPQVAGLFAEGRVDTGSTQALTLPDAALVRQGEQVQAWRVDGQHLRRVSLKLGERDARSGEWPVLAGLAAGERVLRNPGSSGSPLVDGQAVVLAPPPAPSLAASTAASTATPGR